MTTLASTSAAPSVLEFYPSIKGIKDNSRKPGTPELSIVNRQIFDWECLTSRSPLVYMLQPDFYTILRSSSPGHPVYQHNLSLDLGPYEVKYEALLRHMHPLDSEHLYRIDHVLHQFSMECRLQPFDYICSAICRWDGLESGSKYFMRKSTILQCDAAGLPSYTIITFKDITSLVSASKPNNTDVTFMPEKAGLSYELSKRIEAVHPKSIDITAREKEIVRCLYIGMSSKAIASALFISKATVDTHRQNMIRKWEVPNTAALLKKAVEEGVV